MKREMIRKQQQLSQEACEEILKRNTNGVLSLNGDDGFPYGVPISYVWFEGKIYFHSGGSGYKVDCIRRDSKASFTVVDLDQVVGEEYTTYFRSVIVSGNVAEVYGDERISAFKAMTDKYSPSIDEDARMQEVKNCSSALLFCVSPEEITGKQAEELK